MEYKCDICSTTLPSKSHGRFYDQQRVLTSPSYWEKLIRISPNSFNDDAFGITLQTYCNDSSGFTVCQNCASLLKKDVEKSKEYGIERFVSSDPSGSVEKTSAIIVASTVWEKMRGHWPASIDVKFKQLRNELSPSSTKTNPNFTSNSAQTKSEESSLYNMIQYILLACLLFCIVYAFMDLVIWKN